MNRNKHNAELQRTAPDTQDTEAFSTRGRLFFFLTFTFFKECHIYVFEQPSAIFKFKSNNCKCTHIRIDKRKWIFVEGSMFIDLLLIISAAWTKTLWQIDRKWCYNINRRYKIRHSNPKLVTFKGQTGLRALLNVSVETTITTCGCVC